jgi:hypothetical protein
MKAAYSFFKSIFLQLILGLVSYFSWKACYDLGFSTHSQTGTYVENTFAEAVKGTDVALSTGYTGGAIAMGAISSICIVMIVWIEVNKSKSK